jgi:prolyl-tRNA synthetase
LTDLEHYIAADYAQHGESVKYYHCFFATQSSDADNTTQRLSKIAPGDPCPSCPDGRLTVQRAIEVGHTFHLGTRYSSKLGATITTKDNQRVDMEMGCHGIGISRMIAAIASVLADEKGLNWPRAIAPFQVVIIPRSEDLHPVAEQLYDKITSADGNIDAIIDDRENRSLIQGLVNAELIGFPVTIVVGRSWEFGKLEIQCRHPGTKLDLSVDDAMNFVPQYLATL